ncbi:MAG: glyoxalase [Bdellovibrionales bacterium GWB1_55_8]|nr:MAG: glyoxalase [Bdellovibrionales bacterium GWB1_55_8]
MAKAVKPIPEGYHSLTPHIVVKDAERAINFYKQAFGAIETARMSSPDGKRVVHAELKIGDSPIMLGEEMGPGGKAAETLGGSPVSLYFYVSDVDQSYKKALEAGGKEYEGLADMFWGDRCGTLQDPFGYYWTIATHREDLSQKEMEERGKEFFAKMAA